MELSSSPPPLAPPTTEEDKLSWLRLLRSRRVGPATFLRLMRQHGAAQAALHALPDVAAEAGMRGYQACPEGVALAEWRAGRRAGARALFLGAPDYPVMLAAVADAPPMLWALGDATLGLRPCVALVGARNASSMGLRMARRLASELGQDGIVVTSGMARGIDAEAHAAALPTGTVAVLAGGVDSIYPQENATLYRQIRESGLIVSERPPGFRAGAQDFPRRNRLISGMSAAIVVVEAAARSGTLGTARMALDQGREVLAVPGHPMDPRAAGANLLIRDGAQLVCDAGDVLAALGPATGALTASAAPASSAAAPRIKVSRATPCPPAPPRQEASRRDDLAAAVMNSIGGAALSRDQLCRDLRVSPAVLEGTLTTLELDGLISRAPGGLVLRET